MNKNEPTLDDLPTLDVDVEEDAESADWPKRSWDLDAHSVPELAAFLAASGVSVAHFKTLPVYRYNLEREPWLKQL